MKQETLIYPSSGGTGRVSAQLFIPDQIPVPRGILQISHGMCEHMGRYEGFAAWLCSRGFAVCGNDHLGHRNTALLNREKLGYFGPRGSRRFLVGDLELLRRQVAGRYPGVPYFLLGHSMGSFIARLYAASYGRELKGLLISGTAGKNPAAAPGRALCRAIELAQGPQYVSKMIYRMSNGSFNRGLPSPSTPVDWLSRDPQVCAGYCRDSYCTFHFTVSAYYELMDMVDRCNRPQWYEAVPKALPIYIFSGDRDPVGNFGAGPKQVYKGLTAAGVRQVELKLYEGGRHEMLNEINREQVFRDVLSWMEGFL